MTSKRNTRERLKKSLGVTFVTAALLAGLAGNSTTAYATPDTGDSEQTVTATSRVTITDLSTGEIVYESSTELVDTGNGKITASAALPPSITPFGSIGGSMNPGSVKSSITITYSLKGKDQIRTENVKGSWAPGSNMLLQKRGVEIYSGGLVPSVIKKTPTSNSYNYNTGWGFQIKPPSDPITSPRALATVQYKMNGAGSRWLEMQHWVDLSSV